MRRRSAASLATGSPANGLLAIRESRTAQLANDTNAIRNAFRLRADLPPSPSCNSQRSIGPVARSLIRENPHAVNARSRYRRVFSRWDDDRPQARMCAR